MLLDIVLGATMRGNRDAEGYAACQRNPRLPQGFAFRRGNRRGAVEFRAVAAGNPRSASGQGANVNGNLRDKGPGVVMEADELRLKMEEMRICVGASLWCFAVSQAATKAINEGKAPSCVNLFAWWFALPIKDRNDAVAEAAGGWPAPLPTPV